MYANVRNARMRRGEPTRRSISGSSAWIWATMPPIGSSTSGSQISSWSLMARKDTGRCDATAMRVVPRRRSSSRANRRLSTSSGSAVAIWTPTTAPAIDADAQQQSGPPADVAVVPLPPRSRRDGRQDRQQRRRLGVDLRQPKRNERRHEEDPAADAEEAGEKPCCEAEADREDDRGRTHETSNQTASAASNPENASVSDRPETRCWTPVPTTAPAAAGRPTRAA